MKDRKWWDLRKRAEVKKYQKIIDGLKADLEKKPKKIKPKRDRDLWGRKKGNDK
jgi:hypothetical protein